MVLGLSLSATVARGQNVVIVPCDGDPTPATYCYANNVEHIWQWESECGYPIFLQFLSGTIESSLYDHLRVHDGPDEMSPLIYGNPELPELQDLAGLSFMGNSGRLYMRLTTNSSNCCATNGLVASDWQPWEWAVSAGTGAGIHEVRTADLRLYPNPATERVQWEWPGQMEGEVPVRLVDGSGRMMRQERMVAFPGGMGTMSLEGLGDGLYTVLLLLPEGRVAYRLQVSR